jgi:hypothetical protein
MALRTKLIYDLAYVYGKKTMRKFVNPHVLEYFQLKPLEFKWSAEELQEVGTVYDQYNARKQFYLLRGFQSD